MPTRYAPSSERRRRLHRAKELIHKRNRHPGLLELFCAWLGSGLGWSMMRVWRIALMALALLLAGSPCKAAGGRRARTVEAGVKEAGLALGGPKPFVDIVCPIMQQQAERAGPAADAVRAADLEGEPLQSAGRQPQGRARASPSSCRPRPRSAGSTIRSSRKSAIVHSASLLADLRHEFGNFGLAAAAYNAGAERVRAWLAGSSETAIRDAELCRIRHRPRGGRMEAAETELPQALKTDGVEVQASCAEPRAAGGAGCL